MSSGPVVLTNKGLRKLREAIERMGGTLEAMSKETGVPVSTIQMLIDQEPMAEKYVEQLISALSVVFDNSLVAEPIETPASKEQANKRKLAFKSAIANPFTIALRAAALNQVRLSRNQIIVDGAAAELSETRADDVQGIASAQLKILASYYDEALNQAKASFRSAVMASVVGFFFFLVALILVLDSQPKNRDRTLVPLISGAITEVVAGLNFYLYGQATKQLAAFQRSLDQTQRYLLANSICESVEGDDKNTARIELVKTVSSPPGYSNLTK